MASNINSKQAQVKQELEEFLNELSTTPEDIDQLSKYLKARPKTASIQTILPVEEVEERLQVARQVVRRFSEISVLHLSIIMTLPLETIRSRSWKLLPLDPIEKLVRIFLQASATDFDSKESGEAIISEASTPATVRKRKSLPRTESIDDVDNDEYESKSRKRKSLPRTESIDDVDNDEYESKSRKRKSLKSEPPDDDSNYSPEQISVTGKVKITRNANQRKECLERDKAACIILGTAVPEACHIIPFAVNSTTKNLINFRTTTLAECLWPGDNDNFDLLIRNVGCSDKAWNMLSLNRQLHKWWSKSYFALKCLGITPQSDTACTIQLQFHWMRQLQAHVGTSTAKSTDRPWAQTITLKKGEGEKIVEEWKEGIHHGLPVIWEPGGIVSATDANTSRLIHTGHVFDILMTTDKDLGAKGTATAMKKAENMKAMIDLQWACIQIATMSGAAGSPEFLVDEDEDEDDIFDLFYAGRLGSPYADQYEHKEKVPEDLAGTSSE